VQRPEQQSGSPLHVAPTPAQHVFPVPQVVRLSQAVSPMQSALFAQAHAPAVHVGPGPHVAVQLEQLPPPVPHAPSSPPAAHVPELQQPPLQMVSFVP